MLFFNDLHYFTTLLWGSLRLHTRLFSLNLTSLFIWPFSFMPNTAVISIWLECLWKSLNITWATAARILAPESRNFCKLLTKKIKHQTYGCKSLDFLAEWFFRKDFLFILLCNNLTPSPSPIFQCGLTLYPRS